MAVTRATDVATAQPVSPKSQAPAALAGARLARASYLLGGVAMVTSLFVLARLAEAWRVAPGAPSHHVSIFGAHLSYPAANAGAIMMLVLAGLGLLVSGLGVSASIREGLASRRFGRRLAQQAVGHMRDAVVIDDGRPRAFCAGLVRPRVYISTGALTRLGDAALEAVLAHERHHARRRDPLRLCVARVLAHALFMLPGFGRLIESQQAMAELSADESAISAGAQNRAGLADAMLTFSHPSGSGISVGIDPVRVDYLLGTEPSWRFPLAIFLGGAVAMGLLAATAVLAAQVARGSATLAPPFLSAQPCVIALAAIPIAACAAAALHIRKHRSR